MLHSFKLGLAGGIIWALSMFACTIVSIYTGFAGPFLNAMASIYIGYNISWWGSLIGLVYGFFDVFIGLFLLAWLYNLLVKSGKKAK